MPDREREQVEIGQLARTMNPRRVSDARIEQAHIVRPELVQRTRGRLGQPLGDHPQRRRVRISRVRHHAHARRLSDRARRPALCRALSLNQAAQPHAASDPDRGAQINTLTSSSALISTHRPRAADRSARCVTTPPRGCERREAVSAVCTHPGLPGPRSRAAADGGDLRKHPPARRNAFPARQLRQRAREDPLRPARLRRTERDPILAGAPQHRTPSGRE